MVATYVGLPTRGVALYSVLWSLGSTIGWATIPLRGK